MGGSVAGLERALREEGVGEIQFDAFARGRYATDASSYQIMPLGVVIPGSIEEAARALRVARSRGVPVLPRGGGTSQSGQTVNAALVVDCSKRLTKILSLDAQARRCKVEPGIVLDELNRRLKPEGLWFPVDISTASRATIGGMAGNNSCGGRSLRYGTMRDNVLSIDAVLADGSPAHFGAVQADLSDVAADDPRRALFADILRIGAREADEVAARFPAVQRRVGGYNLDALTPPGSQSDGKVNLAHLLVGSEGTLAFSTAIELKLVPLLGRRAVGVCHFGSFFEAMDAAQHIVALKPIAVELVDRTMIGLAAEIPIFQPTLKAFLRGDPEALLVVEFAESDDENRRRLSSLTQLLGDLGFGWDREGKKWGGVVEVLDPALQTAIAEMRAAGLNIMMSMKDDAQTRLVRRGLRGPAAASGRIYRPADRSLRKARHARDLVRARLGRLPARPARAQSETGKGRQGDARDRRGGLRHGARLQGLAFGRARRRHRPLRIPREHVRIAAGARLRGGQGSLRSERPLEPRQDRPGAAVRRPRRISASGPIIASSDFAPALDWSAFPGAAGGFSGAVEMCNNNGECRKLAGGAMCPSYRVTRDERDVTRGRANSLRLAISGQLGAEALASDEMAETLKLCVSCKACRRECPTGVDMARMKIEVLAARARNGKLGARERLVAYLPRYAALASRFMLS